MDVFIDTEDITEGLESIAQSISSIENCVEFIQSRLSVAGNDFTSINYYRASDSIKTAEQAINEMFNKLEIAKGYLNQLSSYIEAYNGLIY